MPTAFIEDTTQSSGALQTNFRQPQAIGRYEHRGYRRRGPLGGSLPDPNGVLLSEKQA